MTRGGSGAAAPKQQFEPERIEGWLLLAHPLFDLQYEKLERQVEQARAKDPVGYVRKNAAKRFKAVVDLVYDEIPADPANARYRLGKTLGSANSHWRRAKFYQQYRLFFRFDSAAKIIVYAWVNDEDTKRAYESDDDAYRTFAKMLAEGDPPADFKALVARSKAMRASSARSQ